MYQHFKDIQRGLIFNGLFRENECFKRDENNSKLITNIIVDMLLQNFDADYNKYIQNNDDFCRRMSKLYLTHKRWDQETYTDTGGTYAVIYAHNWMDHNVISKLNIPKDWLIFEEREESWAGFGRLPVHVWRYDHLTKDTIEYNPGFDSWGEYFTGSHQQGAAENSLHFSKDVLKSLITGFIRETKHDIQSRPSLMSLCIDYLYSSIPLCFSWISGWLSNPITKPIDIDYVTGIVTIRARDSDYEQNWSSELMCREDEECSTYPDKRDDRMEIFEGMWDQMWNESGDKFYHRIEIKCIENMCDFGIGIKKPSAMWFMFIHLKDNMLNVAEESDYEENGIRTIIDFIELNNKVDIVLSIDVIYKTRHETNATFYLNGKEIKCLEIGGWARRTGHYYHPIFIFDTDKSRKDISTFEIQACVHSLKQQHQETNMTVWP